MLAIMDRGGASKSDPMVAELRGGFRRSVGATVRTTPMVKPLSSDDVLPLVACLTPHERLRLVRLISERSGADDAESYRALPPTGQEFSSDEQPLAWDAEGWKHVG